MSLVLSVVVIVSAILFFFAPMFCGIPGANIGGFLWMMFVMPVLLVLVNLLDNTKAAFVAYGQAILIAIIIIVSCIDNAIKKQRRSTPATAFDKKYIRSNEGNERHERHE